MTRAPRTVALIGAFLFAAVTAVVTLAGERQAFPHEQHAGLFPLCEGCHEGVPTGDRATFYPPPATCARCHDGVEQPRVDWQGPTEEPDNIDFSHPEHPSVVGGEAVECTRCHTQQGARRMAVEPQPVVARCLACHAHEATDHYVDADCATCHVPLAQAPFERQQIEALPLPDDHRDEAMFIRRGHGRLAEASITRCAVCHTRERCESCHVNAADVAAIQEMPVAPARLASELPEPSAHYPVPRSHGEPGFLEGHGERASRVACATCHTRDDCAACHVAPVPSAVAELPTRVHTRAPGVQVARRMPASHEAPMFATDHGNEAAVRGASCSTCHERTMCVDCHDAVATGSTAAAAAGDRRTRPGGFHPPNFVARHSAEAYARRLECSSCHDSRLFCAACHNASGMSPGQVPGRLGPGFHDAEPLWLLRHGRAARQALESCASCHGQNECMQCHSVLGAFKVNPHGPGFDARRAQKRNAAICLVCHITDPLAGGAP